MRTLPKWVDKIQDSDKVEQCIYDLCFNPEGTQLVVASGNRVLVYDTGNGALIQPLKGHKDMVYCVAYAKNGEKFASGSADKTVIVWSNKLLGLLKYSHSDAVQCLSYNPVSNQLASCALTDFAFWTAEQKAVQKHKVTSRINTCSWTNDGLYLALGLGNGMISIRNKDGEEKGRIERPGNPSIWAISWSPSKDDPADILCVTDWSNTLSFYTLGGKLIGKERQMGFDALRVHYFPNGEYLLISGTNKTCCLYTREGIKLGMVGDQQHSWAWCCAAHPSANFIAVGCQDGTIAYYQLIFNTVHGLYKERYAFREHMTDVIIQHLLTEQKVRIKCRDLIRKIAIYKHRLAVQLPERIVIYELYSEDVNDMHYRVKEKITRRLDCSLLVVCAEHLVICQEKELRSLTFAGVQERDWSFDSSIRYIKVIGGLPTKEGLIVGLKNGEVWQIHLDNSFPILKVTVSAAVRCLDLSRNKEKLAVVDETGLCQVFDSHNGELYFQEPNTNSAVWNSYYEDMIAFSGNNCLSVKVSTFTAHKQQLVGFVVGLTGSRVFCLNGSTISTFELPLSAPMYQYIEKKMYNEAHKIACLGVTNGDWEELAFAALEDLELEVAKLAFIKLQDYNYLELIGDIQERQEKGENNNDVFIGDVLAYRGRFKEAARLYVKAGQENRALAMYTDLRMFDLAQEYLGAGDNVSLVRQKAEWAKNINEHKAAVEMFLSIGETQAAIEIMGEQGWTDQLADLGRRLDKTDRSSLISIAEHLKRLNDSTSAAEIYRRLGDSEAVLKLHIDTKQWEEAFALVKIQPQYKAMVYVPYANWLAENDKFVQSQKAFYLAGLPDEAFKVLQQLTENAVTENRFQDAGYYYWILAEQCLDLSRGDNKKKEKMLNGYYKNEHLAEVYYCYNVIHRYLEDPFTSYMPEALFNISRFLMAQIANEKPKGVSLFSILYTLAKQSRSLGANKLAKQLFDKIQTLIIPIKFQEQVEISTIAARARAYSDPEDLLPMCYRCSTYNPLAANSNRCVNCGHKFIYSFVTFEILPLVEFELDDNISDLEAIRLIETPPSAESKGKQEISETHETLQLDFDTDDIDEAFTSKVINYDKDESKYKPVVVGRKILLSLDSSNVLVCKRNPPLHFQYYRNLIPDVQITLCCYCFKFFHVDDFELQVLQKGFCPFCRVTPGTQTSLSDDLDF
ncbi:hypothetical protein PPYR_10640 [Photinus pyralis]|uniref:Intraflagellar transport protein 122 homolog n=2 Tax=Photinus pyralis TaxID=7054 RepID=A0A5N4AH08_PHOPY|nr:intraflagellar transport protein 122 homolog [Photinus pyralis]KAB0796579.1 hypothetical protein PPYR_10640 [Photinus pyralis]